MDSDFGLWDVLISMFWFMLLITWVWMMIAIIGDIFRDRGLSGGGKAIWTFFLIFVPWLGALAYLVVRGGSMHERSAQAAQQQAASFRSYVQEAAGTPSAADELRKLGELRDGGVITAEDYETAKAKVLA